MKYKIGDKVKCDGGDWWFYGTVSAVFEHSISPCYRLNIDRMEKKSCKFSITQSEFELEPYKEKRQQVKPNLEPTKPGEPEPIKKQRQKRKPEAEPEKVKKTQKPKKEIPMRQISDAWLKNLGLYQKGERNSQIFTWATYNRKQYQTGKLSDDKLEKLNEIDFPFVVDRKKAEKVEKTHKQKKERQKKKKGEVWDMNLEAYRSGEKSNTISSWMAQNRKEYKEGTLPEKKLDKLMEIHFPFETIPAKKTDNWHQRLEEWKKGERRSTLVQQWRQRNIKKYLEGKLEIDKIAKLKEIGILK